MKSILECFNLRYTFKERTETRTHKGIEITRPMIDATMETIKGRSRPTWIFKSYWNKDARNPYLAIRNGLRGEEFDKWTPKYEP